MTPAGLYRWAGYAGVASAILLVVGNSLHPASLTVGNRGIWERWASPASPMTMAASPS
jgi:hypothetical protein